MNTNNDARRGAAKYVFVIMFQHIIGIALFFAAAGTLGDWRGNVNVGLYFVISVAACAIMLGGHGQTLNERSKKRQGTKKWDKLLLPALVLLAYYGIYAAAGLGTRFGLGRVPVGYFYAGTAIYLLSGVFTVWPVLANTYFESTARIQSDRAQTVVTTGPYKIVRHPGYMGILLWALASALMFGTAPACAVSAAVIAVIWIRTYFEDNMLKNELDGYLSYAEKVRYRLIPFVW